eukprot:361957-Chlamydomonas_euryale.AAC.4
MHASTLPCMNPSFHAYILAAQFEPFYASTAAAHPALEMPGAIPLSLLTHRLSLGGKCNI